MARPLDDTTLHNLKRAARERGFAHPTDVIRLVEEVRRLQGETFVPQVRTIKHPLLNDRYLLRMAVEDHRRRWWEKLIEDGVTDEPLVSATWFESLCAVFEVLQGQVSTQPVVADTFTTYDEAMTRLITSQGLPSSVHTRSLTTEECEALKRDLEERGIQFSPKSDDDDEPTIIDSKDR